MYQEDGFRPSIDQVAPAFANAMADAGIGLYQVAIGATLTVLSGGGLGAVMMNGMVGVAFEFAAHVAQDLDNGTSTPYTLEQAGQAFSSGVLMGGMMSVPILGEAVLGYMGVQSAFAAEDAFANGQYATGTLQLLAASLVAFHFADQAFEISATVSAYVGQFFETTGSGPTSGGSGDTYVVEPRGSSQAAFDEGISARRPMLREEPSLLSRPGEFGDYMSSRYEFRSSAAEARVAESEWNGNGAGTQNSSGTIAGNDSWPGPGVPERGMDGPTRGIFEFGDQAYQLRIRNLITVPFGIFGTALAW